MKMVQFQWGYTWQPLAGYFPANQSPFRRVYFDWQEKLFRFMERMEEMAKDSLGAKTQGLFVPIWEKYMLTVDEAVQYFGIGEKKIRMLIADHSDTDLCFTVQIGNKSLINRQKFEKFLNNTTSLQL